MPKNLLGHYKLYVPFPDHTNISIRFQLWGYCGLCWEVDIGPPLFLLSQLEMPTDGAMSGRCDESLMKFTCRFYKNVWSKKTQKITKCIWLDLETLGSWQIVSKNLPIHSKLYVPFLDHTNISVRFQPWDYCGLCWEVDVGLPLFPLSQLEMPTDGAMSGRCDEPLNSYSISSRLAQCMLLQIYSPQYQSLGGTLRLNRSTFITITLIIRDRECMQCVTYKVTSA
jgi:hypothetical protein